MLLAADKPPHQRADPERGRQRRQGLLGDLITDLAGGLLASSRAADAAFFRRSMRLSTSSRRASRATWAPSPTIFPPFFESPERSLRSVLRTAFGLSI